jgi:zinc transporter ZupT
MVIIISIATVIATLLGGMFALRFKDKLHLILGFSAGAVLGVVWFDLLPEALELGGTGISARTITAVIAVGFAAFMILDRMIILSVDHHHDDEDPHEQVHSHAHNHRGKLGAASLSFHSFLDGAAIGLAFQVSAAVGAVVAFAVLVHDFSDGINTVNLILKNNGSAKQAFRWLIVDAIAPALGALSTLLFSVSQQTLAIILSVFCGFFLYIGASDLLPESFHNHPTRWTTAMTVLGMAVLWGAIHLAGA